VARNTNNRNSECRRPSQQGSGSRNQFTTGRSNPAGRPAESFTLSGRAGPRRMLSGSHTSFARPLRSRT
jgi:hypothetical protein